MGIQKNSTAKFAVTGIFIIALILVLGTIWMGQGAKNDTEKAVRSVSLLYLDELAGRREQVVSKNLKDRVDDLQTVLQLMTPEDRSDKAHLEAFQTNMKRLFHLDRFAFVDTDGLIYTSSGYQHDIEAYPFDHQNLSGPEISIKDLDTLDKKVIIALPVHYAFEEKTLSVCFVEIDMQEMLSGVSMQTQEDGSTFCNIYTSTGIALSNTVLGGLAVEDNLLEAMKLAEFETGYSYELFCDNFTRGKSGEISFTYDGIRETLSYVPVDGTDWLLTYLIRESVISERVGSITDRILSRNLLQSLLTIIILFIIFITFIAQLRRNSRLILEKETAQTESRLKQEALEQRLSLQEKLLQETQQREQQSKMITALSADYWSVYYLELDKDEGVCYQSHSDLDNTGFQVGEHFRYLSSVTAYANQYITAPYREEFLRFVQPEAIRQGLKTRQVVSCTYMVSRHGKESYETVRFAGVYQPGTNEPVSINNVGACFVNVDAETREMMKQRQALSDALTAAEEASKAKTVFLSNMSHEIRTPMNAIIGLNSIALNDPAISAQTRGYLEKIETSAEHLLTLINDILDMSRIESGRMTLKSEEFSFSKLLEAINTMFSGQCTEKGLDYQCHLKSEVDDYYIGDNMKLRQVLINILSNAVKFTPEGGKIEFSVERKAKYDGKSTLCFTVSDTGIGISEEFLPHIFDTFAQESTSFSNKYGSSGLGLAISDNIVRMMNGEIQVESEKGKGTTFTVTLTLDDSSRKDAGQADAEIPPSEISVLIVDDDPIACEHASLVLKKAGITAETASSGRKAIELVRLRHARREPYNLILMDWKMPEIDGVETTRQVRSIVGRESAIIILTAYQWDDILEEALQAGVDSFLPKPLFAGAVLEEYRSALKKKNALISAKPAKADLTGRRILLAEDMQINAEIMIMVLQMRQMEVDLAENGRIAVEKFSSRPAGYYDAILMDMRMPEMDGLTATKAIRALDRKDAAEIPIIALTANAFDEDVQRSLQAGLNAHLTKPIQPETLFETLENLITDSVKPKEETNCSEK